MAEDTQVDPLEKTSCVVRRAVTWEISDSEADSDTELWKDTSAVAFHLPAAICNCAGKETCVGMGESSKGPSPAPVPQVVVSTDSLKKRRKKRSPEEAEAELEAKKLERELRKEERMRKREQMVLEKQRRKEAAAALKLLRPDQRVKHLTVCLDPGILEDTGSDVLLEALESSEYKYCLEPQAVPRTITWKTDMSGRMSTAEQSPEKVEEEREVLLLLEPGDFLKRLFSLLQSTNPAGQWSTPDLCELLPSGGPGGRSEKTYDVVVVGLEAYQWYSCHHGNALKPGPGEGSGNRSQPGPELSLTLWQMEEALVMLQLWGNAGVLFLETWTDLAQHVSAMTRAIARRPYKRHLARQPFSFCSSGRWASGIRVGADGAGLREAWCRQIQQFSRVSPAVAAAVAREHPSPHLLLQAYEACDTDRDRQLLLSDIRVETKDSERARRVGPDLSRRIYLFLVSTNPELVLDWCA